RLSELHFWLGTLGILFYIVAIYAAGVTQGLMWRAFDETGRLQYPDFVETLVRLVPMYWVRAFGGLMFVTGVVLCFINLFMTWRSRPKAYEEQVHEAPALAENSGPEPTFELPPHRTMLDFAYRVRYFVAAAWHR